MKRPEPLYRVCSIIGRVVTIKKLYAYITGKSVRQRICICIVLTAMLTLLFFTVKVNFFDKPAVPETSVSDNYDSTEQSESSDSADGYKPPEFHISLIDIGILLAVISAYSVHKIREKKRQRRL